MLIFLYHINNNNIFFILLDNIKNYTWKLKFCVISFLDNSYIKMSLSVGKGIHPVQIRLDWDSIEIELLKGLDRTSSIWFGLD